MFMLGPLLGGVCTGAWLRVSRFPGGRLYFIYFCMQASRLRCALPNGMLGSTLLQKAVREAWGVGFGSGGPKIEKNEF